MSERSAPLPTTRASARSSARRCPSSSTGASGPATRSRALSDAARPVEARVAADLDLPGPLGGIARRGVGAAIGVGGGARRGLRGQAVLGQYDIALFGPGRPPRLLFVGENMEATRRSLEADRDTFLHWVALHECTHVIQFERVAWLATHLRALAAS